MTKVLGNRLSYHKPNSLQFIEPPAGYTEGYCVYWHSNGTKTFIGMVRQRECGNIPKSYWKAWTSDGKFLNLVCATRAIAGRHLKATWLCTVKQDGKAAQAAPKTRQPRSTWKRPTDFVLNEMLACLDLALRESPPDPAYDRVAEEYAHGAGALMNSLSRIWSRNLQKTYPGCGEGEADGAFAVGPCKGTLRRLRRLLLEFKSPKSAS